MKTVVLDLKKNSLQSEAYEKLFQVDSKWSVRVRSSVAHALTEVTKGMFRVYPHKLQLGLVAGQSPYLFMVAESVARDGIKVFNFSSDDSIEKKISMVSEETCFVVLSEDNPITGEIYQVDDLVKKLAEKKIFTVIIRHNNHVLQPQYFSPNPYLIEIRDHQSYAVILLGSRSKKIDDLFLAPVTTDYDLQMPMLTEDKASIENFEESLSKIEGISCYFSNSKNRIWDRSVICLSKNSEPLYQSLKNIIVDGTILCTSKCIYDHPFNYSWLVDGKFTQKNINQWIVLDVIAIKEVKDKFLRLYSDFSALSSSE